MVSTADPIMSRSPSIASDSRFSALSGNTGTFPANPANVQPAPAYVAPFGAVQVLTEHHLTNGTGAPDSDDDFDTPDIKPGKDDVSFTPASLALINAFLDQLLYSFLSTAKSTNLSALKPAVTDILKNKLARDAIASANEELSDLLAGNEEEDGRLASARDASGNNKWDLELVWKRTRLRVMVYMRLGEMEDEDEERHVKEQALYVNGEHSRFSSTAGLVSWSAAIFLTSVLEHVAEQTLQVAGSAAFTRVRRRANSIDEPATTSGQPAIIVDEQDAERIAVNPALGRLWRSWRKTVRANVRPATPTQHREIASIISPPKSLSSPRDSFGTAPESAHEDEADVAERLADHPPDTQYPEHVLASNIRLPMGDALRDVDEIEIPGLARDPSDAGSDAGIDDNAANASERRRSFSSYQSRQAEAQALSPSNTEDLDTVPKLKRRRSSSVPTTPRKSGLSVSQRTKQTDSPSGGIATKAAKGTELSNARPAEESFDPRDDFKALIHDVDNRKSLIDIKTLLAAMDGGSALFGGAADDRQLETIEDRPGSSDSKASFNLVDQTAQPLPVQPIAERQHFDSEHSHDPSQIGVATTSDEAVAPERGPSAQGTRSTPSPHNLSHAIPAARARFSPTLSDESRPAQAKSASADVSQRDIPVVPNASTLAALRESVQRASSPQAAQINGVPKSTSPDTQANRMSLVGQYGPVSAFSNQAQYWESKQGASNVHDTARNARAFATPQTVSDPEHNKPASRAPQDFDQLVQSEEVKKLTLTPERIRDTPKSDAQALAQLTGEVPPIANHVSNKDTPDSRSGRSQVTKSVTATSLEDLAPEEKKRRRWSITKPLSRNTSAHRKSGMIAREARVITESTRDFADFIRSTKPDKEPEVLPFQSSTSLQSFRNSTNFSLPRSQSFTADRTRSLTRSDIDAGHAPPVPSIPNHNKSHMQPKSAKGDDKTGSSELIAFIRDGPRQPDQHRISRSVAPFRTTMDSDRFDEFKTSHPVRPESSTRASGAGVRQSVYSQQSTERSLRASTTTRSPSMNGSTNADNVSHPAYSGKVQSLNALSSNPTDGTFERKRYRNKDPYAIDFMDDDDDDDIMQEEDVSALPSGKRGGESLAEFLRTAESARDGDSKPIASAASIAQARELRERARANNVNGNRRESYYSTVAASTQAGAADATSSRPASRGKPSAGMQARPLTAGRAADRLGLNSSHNNTKDLADFLRNSGPAPAPAPSVSRGTQNQQTHANDTVKKKSRGFFSFFRRPTSKGSAGRHSDMP